MPIYQVVILAIIQGLTEFLPVSSSAHLVVVPKLLHWAELPEHYDLTFDVALHVGTLVAVVLYFWRDLIQIVGQGLGFGGGHDRDLRKNRNLLWLIALGSIPIGIAGLLFEKQAEREFRSLYIVGGMLIFVGILMWIGDRRISGWKTLSNVNATDALTVGVAQAFAVIPGTSRSGATITAALFRNFDRATAARFSFLLSTPAIAAAAAKKAWDIHKHGGLPRDMRLPFALGVIISGVVGMVVIAFFLRYLRRSSLAPFVWYRIIFGIIIIALVYFRVIAA